MRSRATRSRNSIRFSQFRVRYWHLADLNLRAVNVRFRGEVQRIMSYVRGDAFIICPSRTSIIRCVDILMPESRLWYSRNRNKI